MLYQTAWYMREGRHAWILEYMNRYMLLLYVGTRILVITATVISFTGEVEIALRNQLATQS